MFWQVCFIEHNFFPCVCICSELHMCQFWPLDVTWEGVCWGRGCFRERFLSSQRNREFCIALPLGFSCELFQLVVKSFLYALICVTESILMYSVRTTQIRELLIPLRSLKKEKKKKTSKYIYSGSFRFLWLLWFSARDPALRHGWDEWSLWLLNLEGGLYSPK